MKLNERIKARRLQLGITLKDVAESVGVSEATVQRWESGAIANMRRDKIANLAKALHTSPAYLMGWTDDPVENDNAGDNTPKKENETEKRILLLARHLEKIPEEKRENLIKSLETTINLYLDSIGIQPEEET